MTLGTAAPPPKWLQHPHLFCWCVRQNSVRPGHLSSRMIPALDLGVLGHQMSLPSSAGWLSEPRGQDSRVTQFCAHTAPPDLMWGAARVPIDTCTPIEGDGGGIVCSCGTGKSPSNRENKSGLPFLARGSHSLLPGCQVHLATLKSGSPSGLTLLWGAGDCCSHPQDPSP